MTKKMGPTLERSRERCDRLRSPLNHGFLLLLVLLAFLPFLAVSLLALFLVYDLARAASPVIARRFLANRSVLCTCAIGFFDFVRGFLFLLPPRFCY